MKKLAILGFVSSSLLWPEEAKKVEYPYIVNLRTVNDFGHQEVYYTYYPKDEKDKNQKLKECEAWARKVMGAVDSHYRVIIGTNCTVDR